MNFCNLKREQDLEINFFYLPGLHSWGWVQNAWRVRKHRRGDQPGQPACIQPIPNLPIGRWNQISGGCIWWEFIDIEGESWLRLWGIDCGRQEGAISTTVLYMPIAAIELVRWKIYNDRFWAAAFNQVEVWATRVCHCSWSIQACIDIRFCCLSSLHETYELAFLPIPT